MCGFPLSQAAVVTTQQPPTIQPPVPGQSEPQIAHPQGGYIQSPDTNQPLPAYPPETVPKRRSKPQTKKPKRRLRRLVPAVLIVLVLAAGAYLVLQSLGDGDTPAMTVEACQPVKPDDGYQPSNLRDLSGKLDSDTYFAAGEEYTLAADSSLTIPAGVTLLIEPGARVRFGQGAKMVVEGTLLACGRTNRRILFTADADSGYPGFWSGIEFRSADPDSVLGHATIEFAGKGDQGAVWLQDTDLHIEDLKFDSNLWYALSMDPDSYPGQRPPISVEYGPLGWEIRGGDLTRAITWQADTTFTVNGLVEVRQGGSLTIPAGTWVKFLPQSALRFYGDADIPGTSAQPVIFTSVNDQGEENTPDPQAGDWAGLLFSGREGSATLSHVEVRYAGDPSRISGCLHLSDAAPRLENVTIQDCGVYAVSSDLPSEPQIERLTIQPSEPTRWWEIRESQISASLSRTLSPIFVTNQKEAISPVVTGWIGVDEKASLTVEAGVTLLFKGGKNSGFWSNGKINFNGTKKAPILLTSWQDSSAGGEGEPAPGDWAGLYLSETNPADASLDYLQVRYGGAGDVSCLHLENASPKIASIVIQDCGRYPVSSDSASQPQVAHLEIDRNEDPNLWEIRQSSLVERKEWQWASLTAADGSPIIRLITGVVTIKPDASLTLQPGLVLKFTGDSGLVVQGGLNAAGTKKAPILMTSWRDPFGGGSETGAQPGDWGGLIFDGGASTQKMEHVLIRYAGDQRRNVACVSLSESAPVLTNVTISDCENYPISSDMVSNPQVTDLSLVDNFPANEWVIRKSNLKKGLERTWAPLFQAESQEPILRTASGWLGLETGARLTLEPGVVLKFKEGNGLVVNGTLIARGSDQEKITFTSWRDPQYSQEGGVQAGDWVGLALDQAQGDTHLSQVEVRYAGANRNPRGAITLVATSPRLESLLVRDSAWYPLSLDLASKPVLVAPQFSANNPANTLEIRASTLNESGETVISPYTGPNNQPLSPVITGDLRVGENATLRLEPGLVLKFTPQGRLTVLGGLTISDATLTSIHDDEYGGDTDGSIGGETRWVGILIQGRKTHQIQNTLVRFADYGFELRDAAPNFTNTRIEDCWGEAIRADFLSTPAIQGLSLTRNAINGLVLSGNALPDGETYWPMIGSPTNPLVRVLNQSTLVGQNARLRIDPGVIVKFGADAGLVIEGQLSAGQGAEAAPVVFTALEDDRAGGDTNGTAGDPRRGSWLGIVANPNQTNAVLSLQGVEIHYANIGLFITDITNWEYAALSIQDSQLYGLSCDASFAYDPADENLVLVNNGIATESCPTPDR